MSKQANKAVIGGFIVGAMALVVLAVLVFGSSRFLKERLTYVLFFRGSVKGLNVGAPVVFRGVRVGTVKDIKVIANPEDLSMQIPVYVELEPGRIEGGGRIKRDPDLALKMMVERGLRAQLELQSLITGQLMVELDFHPDTPIELVAIDQEYEEIPTVRSSLEELSRTIKKLPLDELATRLTSAIAGIDRAVNAPEMTEGLKILNQTVKDVQSMVRNLDRRIDSLATVMEETVTDYGKVARNVDGRIEPLVSGITGMSAGVQKLAKNLDDQATRLADSIAETSKSANRAFQQANRTLASIEGITGKDSALIYQVKKTLEELSAAARSIRLWADYLERHPEALIRGKGR